MSDLEQLSDLERSRLAPFVSDLDRPVFALMNLPQSTMGALFARYSRYPGTMRRLMLDEFAEELEAGGASAGEGSRTTALFERVLGEYGDDSVAQLGGLHIACEWSSNILTKILQRPRLAAYLEQSTRYIPYDLPMADGGYRYYRSPELGPRYEVAMDSLFATYAELGAPTCEWLAERFPRRGTVGQGPPAGSPGQGTRSAAGPVAGASLSHVGIFASAQTFERLILHLLAHPLPEARRCGEQMLLAMQAAAPSFVTRIERPDRGGEWVSFLQRRSAAGAAAAKRLGLDGEPRWPEAAGVRLLRVEGSEEQLLAALLFEASSLGEAEIAERLARLGADRRSELIGELLGRRENRRHLPGRGFEALRYRFEVISDYGAFRDLQRHRMLTAQWQTLGPHLGAEVPEELREAGLADPFEAALERSREAWQELSDRGLELEAPYALCLAHRLRYILDMNAREAIHLIELRSGREGHGSYLPSPAGCTSSSAVSTRPSRPP